MTETDQELIDELIEEQKRLVARRRIIAQRCDEAFLRVLEEVLDVRGAVFSYLPGASFADTVKRDTLRGVIEILRFEARELGRSENLLTEMMNDHGH